MNTNPNSILFGGEIFDGRDELHPLVKLRDGATAIVRVREMPARHHLELLELFHVGRESDLIQRCTDRGTPGEAGSITWAPLFAPNPVAAVDAEVYAAAVAQAAKVNAAGRVFVDSLDDSAHAQLVDICDKLNFDRAIATAQRQIARGQKLAPMEEAKIKQAMEPMKKEFASWMSSLTTQLSLVLAGRPPLEKP